MTKLDGRAALRDSYSTAEVLREAQALRGELRKYLNATPGLTGYRRDLDLDALGSFLKGIKALLQNGFLRGNIGSRLLPSEHDLSLLLTRWLVLTTRLRVAGASLPQFLNAPRPGSRAYLDLLLPAPRRARGRPTLDRWWIGEIPTLYFELLDSGRGEINSLKLAAYLRASRPNAPFDPRALQRSITEVTTLSVSIEKRIPAASRLSRQYSELPPFSEILIAARRADYQLASINVRRRRPPLVPQRRLRLWLRICAAGSRELEPQLRQLQDPIPTIDAAIALALGRWRRAALQAADS